MQFLYLASGILAFFLFIVLLLMNRLLSTRAQNVIYIFVIVLSITAVISLVINLFLINSGRTAQTKIPFSFLFLLLLQIIVMFRLKRVK